MSNFAALFCGQERVMRRHLPRLSRLGAYRGRDRGPVGSEAWVKQIIGGCLSHTGESQSGGERPVGQMVLGTVNVGPVQVPLEDLFPAGT